MFGAARFSGCRVNQASGAVTIDSACVHPNLTFICIYYNTSRQVRHAAPSSPSAKALVSSFALLFGFVLFSGCFFFFSPRLSGSLLLPRSTSGTGGQFRFSLFKKKRINLCCVGLLEPSVVETGPWSGNPTSACLDFWDVKLRLEVCAAEDTPPHTHPPLPPSPPARPLWLTALWERLKHPLPTTTPTTPLQHQPPPLLPASTTANAELDGTPQIKVKSHQSASPQHVERSTLVQVKTEAGLLFLSTVVFFSFFTLLLQRVQSPPANLCAGPTGGPPHPAYSMEICGR